MGVDVGFEGKAEGAGKYSVEDRIADRVADEVDARRSGCDGEMDRAGVDGMQRFKLVAYCD